MAGVDAELLPNENPTALPMLPANKDLGGDGGAAGLLASPNFAENRLGPPNGEDEVGGFENENALEEAVLLSVPKGLAVDGVLLNENGDLVVDVSPSDCVLLVASADVADVGAKLKPNPVDGFSVELVDVEGLKENADEVGGASDFPNENENADAVALVLGFGGVAAG